MLSKLRAPKEHWSLVAFNNTTTYTQTSCLPKQNGKDLLTDRRHTKFSTSTAEESLGGTYEVLSSQAGFKGHSSLT